MMAKSSIAYQLEWRPALRDRKGRFARAEAALVKAQRDELRIHGRRLVELMQEEAPKRSGEFAKGIRFQTHGGPQGLELEVMVPEPIGTFIIRGTIAHPITPRRAKALRWFSGTSIPGFGIEPSGASGAIFAMRVDHPGTDPNRFHGRAVRRWKPGAVPSLRRMARAWSDALK